MYIASLGVKNRLLKLCSVLMNYCRTNILIYAASCMQLKQLCIEVSYVQLHTIRFMVYATDCQKC